MPIFNSIVSSTIIIGRKKKDTESTTALQEPSICIKVSPKIEKHKPKRYHLQTIAASLFCNKWSSKTQASHKAPHRRSRRTYCPAPPLLCLAQHFVALNSALHWHMQVSWNRGTPKFLHFKRIVHYKLSILGYPHLRKPPYTDVIHISIYCT